MEQVTVTVEMSTIKLDVNGRSHDVDVAPDTPLIFVLRNALKLKGPKLGCAKEQCGACAVLVDGQPALSCVRTVAEFEGKAIRTIEGLSEDGVLSQVQQAFLDAGAAQCGYCTSGIVIATTALFSRNRKPSRQDVLEALDPHLCRCGSHARVLAAIDSLIKEGV